MTKREAKRWACGMAAALLMSDMDVGAIPENEQDRAKKVNAMNELISELQARGDDRPTP